jgi:hypothetical protein
MLFLKMGFPVDPKRNKDIMQIPPPHNKNSMQSFFGKINFVRRFVPYFSKIMKPIQWMIKKDVQFKWTSIEKEPFENIKATIEASPSLQSPYFMKDSLLYTFAYDHTLATVITQKNEWGNEFPITFMSTGLQGAKPNYPSVENKSFYFPKSIK